ncbi:MAG: Hpt domain-containing protein [Desulfovibrio sp.]|jgi:HPt (histidine-containing phosphotransfer) domain-containing protein/ABC-type transporter Mla MlaB component|nr:Hpt domain-containing protein [Desulfovibrio sp.]
MSADLMDLTQSFVEDCREHLDSIESWLMDMEAAGSHQDTELVNSVFRLAHSIKGGAGMLGLDNIKTLAHKLENVLHMVRSNELVPTHAVVDVLLKGFDRLTFLVDNVHESEAHSIDAQVAQLMAIADQGDQRDGAAPALARIETGGTGIFAVDPVSLAQAKSGGNELYLLEFDLIHDIHGKGRMPFEVLKTLTDTGRIVDCKLDFAAVGDLDAFGNSIPFYVLYATILEPKYVAGLVKLPDERVRQVDAAALVPPAGAPAGGGVERFGTVGLSISGEEGALQLPKDIGGQELADLRAALLAGLERCSVLRLDVSGVSRCDVFFHQMLLSVRAGCARSGKQLTLAGPLPEDLRRAAEVQGFSL